MAPSHYFDDEPSAASDRRSVRLLTPQVSLEMVTDRGVFSSTRIDPGTKLLLVDGPSPPSTGRLLDLGCGYGPVAISLAIRSPAADVWAVDVNQRALGLCAENAKAAGVERMTTARPEDVPPDLTFDQIWSNPPIRIGKAAVHDLLMHWLGRLTPTGTAHLVVQKHLGAGSLATWLDGQGWKVDQRKARSSYRLLDVSAR